MNGILKMAYHFSTYEEFLLSSIQRKTCSSIERSFSFNSPNQLVYAFTYSTFNSHFVVIFNRDRWDYSYNYTAWKKKVLFMTKLILTELVKMSSEASLLQVTWKAYTSLCIEAREKCFWNCLTADINCRKTWMAWESKWNVNSGISTGNCPKYLLWIDDQGFWNL